MPTERARWSSGGSPYVTFYLDADVVATENAPAGSGYGRWKIRAYLRMTKGSGSYYGGSGVQSVRGNGVEKGRYSADPFLPSGTTSWNKGPFDFWVNANSNGYWSGSSTSYPLEMHLVYGNVAQVVKGSIPLSRLGTAPARPVAPIFQSATAREIVFKITAPNNGGLTIRDYTMQVATNSSFANIVKSWTGTASIQTAAGLSPATTYYVRYRARNDAGSSSWSPTATMSTEQFSPPSVTVTPSVLGTGAAVHLTPTGSTEVDDYDVQYEYLSPAPIPSPATVTVNTASSTTTISGLRPGASYRWRARSNSGSFTSSWSSWQTIVQPNPSTSPGDYFDGATQAADDQTYAWTGTAHLSTSVANGHSPLGWVVGTVPGGSAIIQRVRGGFAGTYAALMTIIADCGQGVTAGTALSAAYRSPVQPGVLYYGSIYVMPSRPQRMAAYLVWLDADGGVVSTDTGPGVLAEPDEWTRLMHSASAPPGATHLIVRWRDAAGSGFSPWRGGESIRMDAAMITMGDSYPYFDGSTPDTALFDYSWTGTAHLSSSLRQDKEGAPDSSLVDPDCPPLPVAPMPPIIESSCIEEVGIWRRYWVSIPATEVATWRQMVPTIELRTGLFAARQIRMRVYPNPFGYAPDALDLTDWCSEQIISFMPADTLLTLDGVMQRTWAEVQGRSAVAADHLLYGTGGVPATWPELSCGIGYTISLDVPLDAPESNLDISVSLTARE